LAAQYIPAYRAAETGDPGAPVDPVADLNVEQVSTSLTVTGPVRVKEHAAAGMFPSTAANVAFNAMAGALQRHVQAGGRNTIDHAAGEKGRWRRVADADPCTFCAMLVTRGPVYRSEATAKGARAYHDGCGCVPELVEGEWEPTEQEQRWIDAYETAAKQAAAAGHTITKKSVLPRMRALGGFPDTPHPRQPKTEEPTRPATSTTPTPTPTPRVAQTAPKPPQPQPAAIAQPPPERQPPAATTRSRPAARPTVAAPKPPAASPARTPKAAPKTPAPAKLLDNARTMYGSDLSTWSLTSLRKASGLGDQAAKSELAKRARRKKK
jgi:hypothetical protein